MVKRRNSHYAPHKRDAKTRVPIDCTPSMLGPMPRSPKKRRLPTQPVAWSRENPYGSFVG
jgi:hypothetical protein